MQPWFADAKLGIFLHYGIYAVNGIAESWAFFNGSISHADYMRQLDGFTASAYDPTQWAELFTAAGARYAVLTTKHHDGVALWDTHARRSLGQDGELSTVTSTPAGRDLITPYVEAMRAADLKVGLYFSHLDWTHPDYATIRPPGMDPAERGNTFAVPAAGEEDPEAWQRFLAFHRAQLTELIDSFHPDLLWFDGDWERSPEQWKMDDVGRFIAERAPRTIVNGRMTGGFGDYATPEQGISVEPPDGPWELCLTINDSWGYQTQDHNHKSVRQLVRVFVETFAAGGNLLLDVGPTEDGRITPEQAERLRGLGGWIRAHQDAVYPTQRGLPLGHFDGPTALSHDRHTLYLYLFDLPREEVVVRGLTSTVQRAYVVGTGTELEHRRIGGLGDAAGWEYVSVDHEKQAADMDPYCTVVALELDDELKLAPRHHTRD